MPSSGHLWYRRCCWCWESTVRGRSQEANQFWYTFISSGRAAKRGKTSEGQGHLTSWPVADMPVPFALTAFSSSSDAAKFLLQFLELSFILIQLAHIFQKSFLLTLCFLSIHWSLHRLWLLPGTRIPVCALGILSLLSLSLSLFEFSCLKQI